MLPALPESDPKAPLSVHEAQIFNGELGMGKKTVKADVWAKPELKLIGKIRDVRGPSGVGTQAGGGGQNRS